MVGGGRPFLPEMLGQLAPFGAKSPIFNRLLLLLLLLLLLRLFVTRKIPSRRPQMRCPAVRKC